MHRNRSAFALVCAVTLGSAGAVVAAPKKVPTPAPTPAPAVSPSNWPCRQIGSKTVCEYRLGDQVFFLSGKELSIVKSLSDRNQMKLEQQPNSPIK